MERYTIQSVSIRKLGDLLISDKKRLQDRIQPEIKKGTFHDKSSTHKKEKQPQMYISNNRVSKYMKKIDINKGRNRHIHNHNRWVQHYFLEVEKNQ